MIFKRERQKKKKRDNGLRAKQEYTILVEKDQIDRKYK